MNKVNESRRHFLRAAGLGSAGVAAAVLAPAAVPSEPADKDKPPQGKGYRLTRHIRDYYRTARL